LVAPEFRGPPKKPKAWVAEFRGAASERRCKASLSAFIVLIVAACGGQDPPAKSPPTPAPPEDPPALAQIAHACARVSACTHAREGAPFRDPGACVDWWLSDVDPTSPELLRKCLAEASTCDQVSTCMRGGGDVRAAKFCAEQSGVVSGCDGDRLVSCG